MRLKIKDLLRMAKLAESKSVSMQRKLMVYWTVMILTVGFMMLFILSFTGAFSNQERRLQECLEYQLEYLDVSLSRQLDDLTAQSITLSKQLSNEITQLLEVNGMTVSELDNQPELLEKLQFAMYEKLYTTLQVCECSGAYFLLDATVNTEAENAGHSRSGMYLRFANLNDRNTSGKDVVYFRGIPAIARNEQLELHNRWELEFDTSLFPGYEELMNNGVNRLAESGYWTKSFPLTQTWENVMLLGVPVLDGQGNVCGICGVEISSIYFDLSYPAPDSKFGTMILIFAPVGENNMELGKGMVVSDAYLEQSTSLEIKKENHYFSRYKSENETYVGMHKQLRAKTTDGRHMGVALLIPESSFRSAAFSAKLKIASFFLIFLVLMLVLSVYLTWRFVAPISKSLMAVQSEELYKGQQSGISEVDMLVNFLLTKSDAQPVNGTALPPDIEELFTNFASRSQDLTTAEKGILKYYIEGCDAAEIAEKAFISMSTVRKHSGNIYRKLDVASKDELMLYIELFRRCNRLDDLLDR